MYPDNNNVISKYPICHGYLATCVSVTGWFESVVSAQSITFAHFPRLKSIFFRNKTEATPSDERLNLLQEETGERVVKIENDDKSFLLCCCDLCSEFFDTKELLDAHKIKVHNHRNAQIGNQAYRCNLCGKHFRHQSTLSNHKRIHTGIKPYNCNDCGKRFFKRSNMIAHKKIHSGEKPYKCDVCNKFFSRKSNLATHNKIHIRKKPYKCDLCNKHFISLTNNGEKPDKCEACDKAFSGFES